MGGGLMQLVAYGAQDIYLTGQPQITFFKSVYRRHTNFAIESIQQTINGAVNPNSRVSVTISRNGDLLKNIWIQYNPSSVLPVPVETDGAYVNPVLSIGCDFSHALLDSLELEIGGQLIDRIYGKWLTIWRDLTELNPSGFQANLNPTATPTSVYSLTEPVLNSLQTNQNSVATKYQYMSFTHQGDPGTQVPNYYASYQSGPNIYPYKIISPTLAYVPMNFWFCKNPGLAIPLIALQYHEVKFNIAFANMNSFIYYEGSPTLNLESIKVYADYVYLDTTERRQFAQNAHEYLIEQLQYQQDPGTNNLTKTIRLNFNHPVKELIWTGTPVNVVKNNSFNNSGNITGGATPSSIVKNNTGSNNGTFTEAASSNLVSKIILNGTDRFSERHITYFTRNQIWEAHTGFGSTGSNLTYSYNRDAIAVYSFSLRPEEHQPSGTCNFSRIDTAQLYFEGEQLNPLDIYAVNYNVLRIMSGMGGLAYSN